MLKPLFTLLLMMNGINPIVQSTRWTYDDTHAKIGFSISHFGISETEGKFTRFEGRVMASKADFSDADIEITIDVSSIDTDNEQRDEHLRSADFFDAARYPTIVFKGKTLQPVEKNKYKLRGELAMHGVTKEVTLDAIYRGTVDDPFGNTKAGFKVSGVIDRRDWGLEWNGTLAAGGLLVGNDVSLDINIELTKEK